MSEVVYSQRDHAQALLSMLESATLGVCPTPEVSWRVNGQKCRICRHFVGLQPNQKFCPCHVLGEREAIRRAWLALEWRGYL